MCMYYVLRILIIIIIVDCLIYISFYIHAYIHSATSIGRYYSGDPNETNVHYYVLSFDSLPQSYGKYLACIISKFPLYSFFVLENGAMFDI